MKNYLILGIFASLVFACSDTSNLYKPEKSSVPEKTPTQVFPSVDTSTYPKVEPKPQVDDSTKPTKPKATTSGALRKPLEK